MDDQHLDKPLLDPRQKNKEDIEECEHEEHNVC